MDSEYLWLKFAHILIAIIAIGTSAGLAFWLEFYADHPVHGGYVLRAVRRLLLRVVFPGYVLMLITGIWMGHLASLLDAHWAETAMNLWGLGAMFIAGSVFVLKKQISVLESDGPSSRAYRRLALLGRLFGGGTGAVVVVILYFMVIKPTQP